METTIFSQKALHRALCQFFGNCNSQKMKREVAIVATRYDTRWSIFHPQNRLEPLNPIPMLTV